jgi:hypothetical protein
MRTGLRRVLLAFALGLGALGVAQGAAVPHASAACDGSQLSAAQLTAVFANPGVGGGAGYAGGDYQHVYALPDGRNLWLFQDVFFSADNDLRDSLTAAAHNAGLVQNGGCWTVVGGPQMHNFIGSSLTTPKVRWFWPMDGEIGADGALWIFMVEMKNPNGTGASWGAAPVGTWVARVDPSSLAVLSFNPAPDPSGRLYGWSVVSDDSWSYLYGHCYRQYTNQVNSVAQFDAACMPDTYLARVPKGHFEMTPQYWAAGSWTTNPFAATPIMTRGAANPMDVQRFGDTYVNVTKIDDWWGAWLYVDKAPTPWGPWEQDQAIWMVDDRRCVGCGVYHAHLLPYLGPDGKMIVSLSNGGAFNLWYANAYLYRPSFRSVTLPSFRTDPPVTSAGMQPRAPVRAIDTRSVGKRVHGGTVLTVPLAGFAAANGVGVVANVTAVNPAGSGYLTAWPCGAHMPTASVLNYRQGRNTANAVHARVSPSQQLCIYASTDTDVLVDVLGSYVPTGASGLHVVPSTRVYDTHGSAALAAGATLSVPVAGLAGVPGSGATAVSVTVTATDPAASGYLTVWPCSQTRPVVSTANFVAADTIANSATLPLGTNGDLCVYSPVQTHVMVAVTGWWDGAGGRARLDVTRRPLDSRSGTRPLAGAVVTVPLAGVAPAGAVAVIGNATAVSPVGPGSVAVSDCGAAPALPGTAALSYVSAETRAGVAVVPVSAAATVCLTTSESAHLLFDVMVSFGP